MNQSEDEALNLLKEPWFYRIDNILCVCLPDLAHNLLDIVVVVPLYDLLVELKLLYRLIISLNTTLVIWILLSVFVLNQVFQICLCRFWFFAAHLDLYELLLKNCHLVGRVDDSFHLNFELVEHIFNSSFRSLHFFIGKIIYSLVLWVYLCCHDLPYFSDNLAICMTWVMASTNSAIATGVHSGAIFFIFSISILTVDVAVLFCKASSCVASCNIRWCGFGIPLIFWNLIGEIFVVVDFIPVMNNGLNVLFDVLSFADGLLNYASCVNNLIIQHFLCSNHLFRLS